MKIEKLETRVNGDKYSNIYGVYYPSREQYMEKINEIIDVVNTLIKPTEEDTQPKNKSNILSEEEQNRFTKGVLSNCALSFINYLDEHKYEGKMCVSNEECEDIENTFHNAMWDKLHRYYCKYIEKQDEQKPIEATLTYEGETDNINVTSIINEIQPLKFKIGDWITNGLANPSQIISIEGGMYYTLSSIENDIEVSGDIESTDKEYHLWTIKDAKDGDVLITQYNRPFIYNGKHDYGLIGSYCGILSENEFNISDDVCYWTRNENIHPATKEQRDILFKAITDAGYEFDFEKKELKKIE